MALTVTLKREGINRMSGGTRPGIVVKLSAVSVNGQEITFRLKDADDVAYFEGKLNNELIGFFLDAPHSGSASVENKWPNS
jgi:hypothetical protein